MTSADFAEEIAYYNLEPWGPEYEGYSLLASMYYNANKKKSTRAVEYDHFVPKKRVSRRQGQKQIASNLKVWFKAYQANRSHG